MAAPGRSRAAVITWKKDPEGERRLASKQIIKDLPLTRKHELLMPTQRVSDLRGTLQDLGQKAASQQRPANALMHDVLMQYTKAITSLLLHVRLSFHQYRRL
nr:hypothetical protein HK105_005810 [Polyrhizophydium stewartii]